MNGYIMPTIAVLSFGLGISIFLIFKQIRPKKNTSNNNKEIKKKIIFYIISSIIAIMWLTLHLVYGTVVYLLIAGFVFLTMIVFHFFSEKE